ncbi:protein argonaute-3 [Eupeodes corollae]|uniref:protein argonaute-3 n=1 Tax=Eupeodes corollae TaxID=290404 RepID=UPI0024907451|nr:protein argonaute-3 [Eupeodes corollae]
MSRGGFGRGKRLFETTPDETRLSSQESSNSSGAGGDKSVKDSGIDSRSPTSSSDHQRLGRGKLLQQLSLASTATHEPTGRGSGRASVIATLLNSSNSTSDSIVFPGAARGRSRGQLFAGSSQTSDPQTKTSGLSGSGTSSSSPEIEKLTQNVSNLQVSIPSARENISPIPQVPEAEQLAVLKHGNKGRPVPLVCNYIRLKQMDPNKGVYEYEVRFYPEIDSRSIRIKLLNEQSANFGGTKTFDGVVLFLPILLPDKLTTYIAKNPGDNSDVEIRIMYKRKKSLKDCINMYNILFDRIMHTLNYIRFDRKQFDPSAPKIIPQHKLEVWPGYITAVDEYEDGLMLCCDVSHRLLSQKTVLDTLKQAYQAGASKYQENAKKALLGSVVLTRYNNKTYRIDDISFTMSPMSTFQTKTSEITYCEYYRVHHNIDIRDRAQPMLISIKKQRVVNQAQPEELMFCLVPELCYMTGLRDDMRSDFKIMRDIATITRVTPNQRSLALEKFCRNVNETPAARQILENWGLQLANAPQEVVARQFEEEQIFFARNKFSAGTQADFGKYATNNELIDVVHLRNWLVIHCQSDNRVAKSFMDLMERNARPMGINVQRPTVIALQNDRIESYVGCLRENIRQGVQIVVCICPTSRDDRYAAIKKICCAEMPIPSQVINGRTLANDAKNRSIVQKIALQMNCKLGGTLWSVNIPLKNVMICGIDSYHDASQKGNSVAAFVASINGKFTRWYSKAVVQTKREEIVNGLCVSLIAALKAYQKENNMLPDKIIIFRDGVGYGQLDLVNNYEIPQFEAACAKGFQNYSAKITFVVVQKRINTRMFANNRGELSNPMPGTVLDHTVTQRYLYDFFLISQMVRQGTVSPTHYIVVRDDSDFAPDILQRLSYKLCFMYYNWPGTVRVPACCQYAHKMAYLIGQSVKRSSGEELATKLFYL